VLLDVAAFALASVLIVMLPDPDTLVIGIVRGGRRRGSPPRPASCAGSACALVEKGDDDCLGGHCTDLA